MKKSPFFFNSFVFLLFTWGLLVSNLHAQGMGRQQLHGHVPAAAQSAPLLGTLDPTTTLNLAIGLPLRNTDDLQNFLEEVYKSGSSLYRQFLTPEQFTAQYGPSQSDVESVIEFAQANHLTVVKTHSNNMLVDVQGSTADIQKAFHVNLNSYSRLDGSTFHAPDREPSIDMDTPILYIAGLEDSRLPRPGAFAAVSAQAVPASATTRSASVKPNGGTGFLYKGIYTFLGKDYRNVYLPCVASSVNGVGQVVALVEFDTYYPKDISLYAAEAGLIVPSITNISIDGFSTTTKPGGGDEEVSLDIEMAMSMAPDAGIYVYEEKNGASADDLLNQIATDDAAHQISCSWTGFGDATTSNIFLQYAAQGQAFFQAAGDLGSYINGAPEAVVPGPIDRSSLMTVVGGTQLTTSGMGGTIVGTYISESTWNSNVTPVPTYTVDSNGNIKNLVGGGGICSGGPATVEGFAVTSVPVPVPTYQVPFANGTNGGSSIYRNIPDVAMCAITMTIVYNDGVTAWSGGTSAATPLWAGLFALADQLAAETGDRAPIGNPNLALYTLGASNYAANFHDIPAGSNNDYWGNSSPISFTAVSGYDLATGLGSPQCAIVSNLVAFAPVFTPTPTPPPASANMTYTYPEPASGQITFVYASPSAQNVEINLYTFSSQEVASFSATAANSNTNLAAESAQGFANGVYFYVVRGKGTNSVLATGKFVVVH